MNLHNIKKEKIIMWPFNDEGKFAEFMNKPEMVKFRGATKLVIATAATVFFPFTAAVLTVGAGLKFLKNTKRTQGDKELTTWGKIKDLMGMGLGEAIGVLAPPIALGVLAYAGLSNLAGYTPAFEGLAQGSVIGFTSTYIIAPVLIGATAASGIYEAVTGKKSGILETGISMAQTLSTSVEKSVGVMKEDTPGAQKVANLGKATEPAVTKATTVAKSVSKEAGRMNDDIAERTNIDPKKEVAKTTRSYASRFASAVGLDTHAKKEASRPPSSNDRLKGQ
jgi:hypothetical protein